MKKNAKHLSVLPSDFEIVDMAFRQSKFGVLSKQELEKMVGHRLTGSNLKKLGVFSIGFIEVGKSYRGKVGKMITALTNHENKHRVVEELNKKNAESEPKPITIEDLHDVQESVGEENTGETPATE